MKSADLRLLLSRAGGRRLFITAIIAALLWSVLIIANAFLISEIIVRIIRHTPGITRLILILGILWIVRAVFQAQFEYWTTSQAIQIKRDLRGETTSEVGNFSAVSPGELSNILTKGLNSLDIYLGRFMPQLLFAAITPLAVIATIFAKDLISGVIAIVTLPLIPFFGALIGRYSADSVTRKWGTLGTLSKYFEDSLRGFVTLKIFGRSESQSKRIGEMGDKYTDETMKVLRISFLSAFALELVATLSVAVIAVSVGLRLVSGAMELKTALVVLILAPEVYFPVRNAASLFHASQDGTQALHELSRVSEAQADRFEDAIKAIDRKDIASISWEPWNLVPAAEVHRGEMLFITGESGIGKTTFSNNLLGFSYDAQIRLHGADKELTLDPSVRSDWQKLVGWIPQNPQLASGTLRNQFHLLSSSLTDIEIENALRRAGLSIADLPKGLDTLLGRGGESSHAASGGQIRRIAVARALIRNPLVVIADEPTADLDEVSASAVMESLREAQRGGAIVICISHDLALVEPEDLLCSMQRRGE